MNRVGIQFLGSGDAFGSGDRLQSCILVKYEGTQFLIDCGASSLIGMNHCCINPNDIKIILISHLHADHFGGIPFFIIASQLIFKRTEPLLIEGPPGMKERLAQAMEVMFPGSSGVKRKFNIEVEEFSDGIPLIADEIIITPYMNSHVPIDSSFALRVECNGKIIAYSGDTEWVKSLYEAAKNSDLFISEAYNFEKKVKGHMDYQTLIQNYEKTGAKNLILTHMSNDMLSNLDKVNCEYAEDGKVFEI